MSIINNGFDYFTFTMTEGSEIPRAQEGKRKSPTPTRRQVIKLAGAATALALLPSACGGIEPTPAAPSASNTRTRPSRIPRPATSTPSAEQKAAATATRAAKKGEHSTFEQGESPFTPEHEDEILKLVYSVVAKLEVNGEEMTRRATSWLVGVGQTRENQPILDFITATHLIRPKPEDKISLLSLRFEMLNQAWSFIPRSVGYVFHPDRAFDQVLLHCLFDQFYTPPKDTLSKLSRYKFSPREWVLTVGWPREYINTANPLESLVKADPGRVLRITDKGQTAIIGDLSTLGTSGSPVAVLQENGKLAIAGLVLARDDEPDPTDPTKERPITFVRQLDLDPLFEQVAKM